jgi:hypothetical protein
MLDKTWPGWSLLQSGVTGAVGLLGVFAGGWITGRNQRVERQHARKREQLEKFYSPLIGMRDEIRSKSELRVKLHEAGDVAWKRLFEGVAEPWEKKIITDKKQQQFDKLLEYSEAQLKQDLVPLYGKMLDLYTSNMWLAEPSTLKFHFVLTEYVEIWNRFLGGSLPKEVLAEIQHGEANLKPFYEDLQSHFDRLSKTLSE